MSGPEGTTHGALQTTATPIDGTVGVQTVLVTGYPPDILPGDYLRMASLSSTPLRWQEIDHIEDVFGTQTKVCFRRPGETRPGRLGAFLLDNQTRVQIARPVDVGEHAGRVRAAWRLARSWTRRILPWKT